MKVEIQIDEAKQDESTAVYVKEGDKEVKIVKFKTDVKVVGVSLSLEELSEIIAEVAKEIEDEKIHD